MATSSMLEECQVWIKKGQESWKAFFLKWETLAKNEENIPESELIFNVNDKCKLKNQIHSRVKRSSCQKRISSIKYKKQKSKQKKIIRRKKKVSKQSITAPTHTEVLKKSSDKDSLVEVTDVKKMERTLTGVFADLLKANRNNCEVFAMLYQTFSREEEAVKKSEYLFSEQKHVLLHKDFKLKVGGVLSKKQQIFSSPIPKVSLNTRSVCPPRHAYIQNLYGNLKTIDYNFSQSSSYLGQWPNLTIGNQSDLKNYSDKQQYFASVFGTQTPPPVSKLNQEVKSCPPLFSTGCRLEKAGLESIQLDFKHEFQISLGQQINKGCFKNIPICKTSTTQEGKRLGTLCLHKRTNSVSLRMGNSNFITPERKSSEQKCFNKIVSQRRRPSKKLFFDNEEDDSESDDQAEYRAPLIRRQNKRQKVDEPEAVAVVADFDLDDCDAIFDRIVKA